MTPVSGTTIWLPKSRLTVVVSEMAIPEASAVTMWEVPCLDVIDQATRRGAREAKDLRFEGLQPSRIIR